MNILRFTLVMLGLMIGLPVLALIVESVAGFDITSSAFNIIPPMLAAMVEGQALARGENRGPTAAERLRLTLIGTGIYAVLQLVLLGAVAQLVPMFGEMLFSGVGIGLTSGLLIFFVVVAALSIYFFYWFGAKNELKAIAKREERKSAK